MRLKITLLIIILLLQQIAFAQKNKKEEDKKPRDFFITHAGDTIFGNMGELTSWTPKKGTVFHLNTKDDKIKVTGENAKCVKKDGDVYDLLLLDPKDDKPDGKKDFMKVMMRNTSASLYLYTERDGNMNVFESYYMYSDGKFIDQVKRKNHAELIQKYFGNCKEIQKAFTEKDNWWSKMFTLSERYQKECK